VKNGSIYKEEPPAKIIRSESPDWTWCALCRDDGRRPYVGNCPEDCARRTQLLNPGKEDEPKSKEWRIASSIAKKHGEAKAKENRRQDWPDRWEEEDRLREWNYLERMKKMECRVVAKRKGCPNLDLETGSYLGPSMPTGYSLYTDDDPRVGLIDECRRFKRNESFVEELREARQLLEMGYEVRDFYFLDGKKAMEEYRFRRGRGEIYIYSCATKLPGDHLTYGISTPYANATKTH
jgi:hypothetical protein